MYPNSEMSQNDWDPESTVEMMDINVGAHDSVVGGRENETVAHNMADVHHVKRVKVEDVSVTMSAIPNPNPSAVVGGGEGEPIPTVEHSVEHSVSPSGVRKLPPLTLQTSPNPSPAKGDSPVSNDNDYVSPSCHSAPSSSADSSSLMGDDSFPRPPSSFVSSTNMDASDPSGGKRKRGRPRKNPIDPNAATDQTGALGDPPAPRRRGRPPKVVAPAPIDEGVDGTPVPKRGRGRPKKAPGTSTVSREGSERRLSTLPSYALPESAPFNVQGGRALGSDIPIGSSNREVHGATDDVQIIYDLPETDIGMGIPVISTSGTILCTARRVRIVSSNSSIPRSKETERIAQLDNAQSLMVDHDHDQESISLSVSADQQDSYPPLTGPPPAGQNPIGQHSNDHVHVHPVVAGVALSVIPSIDSSIANPLPLPLSSYPLPLECETTPSCFSPPRGNDPRHLSMMLKLLRQQKRLLNQRTNRGLISEWADGYIAEREHIDSARLPPSVHADLRSVVSPNCPDRNRQVGAAAEKIAYYWLADYANSYYQFVHSVDYRYRTDPQSMHPGVVAAYKDGKYFHLNNRYPPIMTVDHTILSLNILFTNRVKVHWLNSESETGSPFDILVQDAETNEMLACIEVKGSFRPYGKRNPFLRLTYRESEDARGNQFYGNWEEMLGLTQLPKKDSVTSSVLADGVGAVVESSSFSSSVGSSNTPGPAEAGQAQVGMYEKPIDKYHILRICNIGDAADLEAVMLPMFETQRVEGTVATYISLTEDNLV